MTLDDLLLALSDIPRTVGEIMSRPVITLELENRVEEAMMLMKAKNIGSLVVVKEDRPVGIVTGGDILRRAVSGGDVGSLPLYAIMTSPLISCRKDQPILKALIFMHENRIRRLPVVESERLMGMITEGDLIQWLLWLVGYPNAQR